MRREYYAWNSKRGYYFARKCHKFEWVLSFWVNCICCQNFNVFVWTEMGSLLSNSTSITDICQGILSTNTLKFKPQISRKACFPLFEIKLLVPMQICSWLFRLFPTYGNQMLNYFHNGHILTFLYHYFLLKNCLFFP